MNMEWAHAIALASLNALGLSLGTRLFFSAFGTVNRKKEPFTLLVFLVMFYISQLAFDASLIKPTLALIGTFVITLAYNMKMYMRVLLTFLFIAIMSAVELVAGFAIIIVLKKSLVEAEHGLYDYMGVILSQSLNMLVCYIISCAKHKKLLGMFKKKYLVVYTLPLATAVVVWFEYYVLHYLNMTSLRIVGLLSMIMLVVANALIFYIIDDMQKNAENENRLLWAEETIKMQTAQYTMMLGQNHEIMRIRHDHKHFLMGALSELKDGNTEALMQSLTEQLELVTNDGADRLCGISSVDAVISQKTDEAREKGILLQFTHKNVKDISFSGIDLAILLGNAIDNAVEAVENLPEKAQRKVEVFLIYREPMLLMTVTNPVAEDLDTENLKTTKADKKLHGFGISTMENIAKKYNGDVSVSCEDKLFKAVISLYDNKI